MLPIWSLGNGRLIVSMDISMHPPSTNLPCSHLLCLFLLSLQLLPLPRRPACRLPHVRSCMFFFRKTFSLLPFKADTFAHFAHRAAASATATARPHASSSPSPSCPCPLARAAGFCPRLGFYPRTHLARKRRARINLLNFAAFATVAAASVAATASACGMY